VDKDRIFLLLKKICEVPSPSGFEDNVRSILIEELGPYADKLWIDPLGNLIALKKGKGEGKLMIATHMDEIGIMINSIDKNGFLYFTTIGGWIPHILPGQRVLIRTLDGRTIRGVIGIKPPHIAKPEEKEKAIPIDKLFIDIGASSQDDAKKYGVTVGAVGVLERTVEKLANGDYVTGRAFDDKVGVAVAVEAFKMMNNLSVDVYLVLTVQEEVGLKGAITASYAINPDVGMAIDVTIATDVPGAPESKQITKLGKGPAIKIMDGRDGRGIIVHPAVRELLIRIAEEENIPYQLEVLPGGTTDASAIQLSREGVPTGAISIPTRYVHSPVEVVNLNDAVNAAKLLVCFASRINGDWIRKNLRRDIK